MSLLKNVPGDGVVGGVVVGLLGSNNENAVVEVVPAPANAFATPANDKNFSVLL